MALGNSSKTVMPPNTPTIIDEHERGRRQAKEASLVPPGDQRRRKNAQSHKHREEPMGPLDHERRIGERRKELPLAEGPVRATAHPRIRPAHDVPKEQMPESHKKSDNAQSAKERGSLHIN
jgi:hypothetical protein